jgi:DNA-binding transcriptional LysR family regulator
VGRVEQAFGIIDGAADQWRIHRSAQLVKMSVVPAFAKLWLFERLISLEAGPPTLRIQLDIGSRNLDVAAGEVDLAIRYGHGVWPNVDVEPFLPETLYPVAHPDIAADLKDTDDAGLLAYPLLHDSDLTGWRAWFTGRGIMLKPRSQDRRFEDYSLVLAAAEAGLGIALARMPLADTWLRRSKLIRLSHFTVACPLAYHFVTAKKEKRPEVLSLMEQMQKAAQQSIPVAGRDMA